MPESYLSRGVARALPVTRPSAGRLLLFALVLSLAAPYAAAQNPEDPNPSLNGPTQPNGYSVSRYEQFNPFNGEMGFALPVLNVIGRGSAAYSMPVIIENKLVLRERYSQPSQINYAELLRPDKPHYTPGEDGAARVRYGPGAVNRVTEQGITWDCSIYTSTGGVQEWYDTEKRTVIKFTAPDGGVTILRDAIHDGKYMAPYLHSTNSGCSRNPIPNRGKIFKAKDGTAMTFISTSDVYDDLNTPVSGVLLMKDGTRYVVGSGQVTQIVDRNGNSIAFTYESFTYPAQGSTRTAQRLKSVTDSLGRQVTINYDVAEGGDFGTCDQIIYKGAYGDERKIRVTKTRPGEALRPDYSLMTHGQLFPGTLTLSNEIHDPALFDPEVISSVWLPDGRRYQFFYNSYCDLSRVITPTGGKVEYDWAAGMRNLPVAGFRSHNDTYRRAVERRSYPDGTTLESKTAYSRPDLAHFSKPFTNWPGFWGYHSTLGYVDIDTLDPLDNDRILSRERTHHTGTAARSASVMPSWKYARVWRTQQYGKNAATLLRQIDLDWEQRERVSWEPAHVSPDLHPLNDPRLVTTVTTVEPQGANLVTKLTSINPQDSTDRGYDQFNNQTDVWEYEYGEGAVPLHPIRHTHTDYVTIGEHNGIDYRATAVHIRNLPRAQQVYSVNPETGQQSATPVTRSEAHYDEYALEPYGAVLNWSAPAGDAATARGNQTRNLRWLDTDNTWLGTRAEYDQCGNIFKSYDSRGNLTELTYAPEYHRAFLTKATSADPDGTAGPLTKLVVEKTYDLPGGLLTSTKDANGRTTRVEYMDMDRPTRVERPDGSWTTYDYGDEVGDLYVHTKVLRESEPAERVFESYQFFDGWGRAVRTTSLLPDGRWSASATDYDGEGRVAGSTNPYETTDHKGAVPASALWTKYEYDSLDRPWRVTAPDGSRVISLYHGNTTLLTDQAGKQRISRTDGLGRVAEVWEVRSRDAASGTEDVTFPDPEHLVPAVEAGYRTTYTYDVLGNLRRVRQGVQRRYFAYDSLSRLLRVRNPEQEAADALQLPAAMRSPLSDDNNDWSLKYEYDENWNLKRRTDARGKVTEYTYDALNRLTLRDYKDPDMTPDVTYAYGEETVTNSKGRLVSVDNGVSAYLYDGYDAMGRVTSSTQKTGGVSYTMPEYKYDKAGNLVSQKYPSGRVVETQYDTAGRVAGVRNQGSTDFYVGGSATDPAARIRYAPHGGVAGAKLGNGLWEHTLYNSRLQPEEIGLGTSADDAATNGSVLRVVYGYETFDAANQPKRDNNGNVRSQKITVPGVSSPFVQSYVYDDLSRLGAAEESGGTGAPWRQVFTYDRYGNRSFDVSQTTLPVLTGPNPTASPAVANPRVEPLTNRIAEDQDGDGNKEYSYDKAGNLTCDPAHCTPAATLTPYYSYNAESKMVSAGGGAQAGGVDYVYDGDGRRVKTAAGATAVVFVYDAAGRLVAEYGNGPTQAQTSSTSYLTQDTIGSTRMVTGQQKEPKGRFDYLPFGGELYAGRADNGGGNVRQKFTGYERDEGTGLDYAQARYFSATAGRFTTVDPILSSGKVGAPQTWNRYAYVLNNPLSMTDPSGLDPIWLTWYNQEGTLTAVRYVDSGDQQLEALLKAGWKKAEFDEKGEFRYTAANGAGGVEVAILLRDGLWKWAGEYDNQVTENPTPAAPATQSAPEAEITPLVPSSVFVRDLSRTDGERHRTVNVGRSLYGAMEGQDVVNGRFGQKYVGAGLSLSLPMYSVSYFSYKGRNTTGLVGNAQACLGQCIGIAGNIFQPSTISIDFGVGSPQVSFGLNFVAPYNPRRVVDIQSFPPHTQQQLKRYHPGYPR